MKQGMINMIDRLLQKLSGRTRSVTRSPSRARVAQNTPTEVRRSVLSPQLGVFGFGLLKNKDVAVGVLPERQEILVGNLSVAAAGAGVGRRDWGIPGFHDSVRWCEQRVAVKKGWGAR